MKTKILLSQVSELFVPATAEGGLQCLHAASQQLNEFVSNRQLAPADAQQKVSTVKSKLRTKLLEVSKEEQLVDRFIQLTFSPTEAALARQAGRQQEADTAQVAEVRQQGPSAGTAAYLTPLVCFRCRGSSVSVRRDRLDLEDSYLATLASDRWSSALNLDGSHNVDNLTPELLHITANYIETGVLSGLTRASLDLHLQAAQYGPPSMLDRLGDGRGRLFFEDLKKGALAEIDAIPNKVDDDTYLKQTLRLLVHDLETAWWTKCKKTPEAWEVDRKVTCWKKLQGNPKSKPFNLEDGPDLTKASQANDFFYLYEKDLGISSTQRTMLKIIEIHALSNDIDARFYYGTKYLNEKKTHIYALNLNLRLDFAALYTHPN